MICGPELRYQAGKQAFDSDALIDEKEIRIHSMPDDSWLVTGVSISTGMCRGDCEEFDYRFIASGVPTGSNWFSSGRRSSRGTYPSLVDADVQMSPDWNSIIAYRKVQKEIDVDNGVWSSERFCFRSGSYQSCGAGPSGAPPEPRQLAIQ